MTKGPQLAGGGLVYSTMVSGIYFVCGSSAAGSPCNAQTVQYTNQDASLYRNLYTFLLILQYRENKKERRYIDFYTNQLIDWCIVLSVYYRGSLQLKTHIQNICLIPQHTSITDAIPLMQSQSARKRMANHIRCVTYKPQSCAYFRPKKLLLRMCKSIYIRSRHSRDRFASTAVFLAIWRRGAGYFTGCQVWL